MEQLATFQDDALTVEAGSFAYRTTREGEWLDRARLCHQLLVLIDAGDTADQLSPHLSPALAALRAILTDGERASSPRV